MEKFKSMQNEDSRNLFNRFLKGESMRKCSEDFQTIMDFAQANHWGAIQQCRVANSLFGFRMKATYQNREITIDLLPERDQVIVSMQIGIPVRPEILEDVLGHLNRTNLEISWGRVYVSALGLITIELSTYLNASGLEQGVLSCLVSVVDGLYQEVIDYITPIRLSEDVLRGINCVYPVGDASLDGGQEVLAQQPQFRDIDYSIHMALLEKCMVSCAEPTSISVVIEVSEQPCDLLARLPVWKGADGEMQSFLSLRLSLPFRVEVDSAVFLFTCNRLMHHSHMPAALAIDEHGYLFLTVTTLLRQDSCGKAFTAMLLRDIQQFAEVSIPEFARLTFDLGSSALSDAGEKYSDFQEELEGLHVVHT